MWFSPFFFRKNNSKGKILSKSVGFAFKIFRTVRQRVFDGKMWYPLFCIKNFDYPKVYEALKDVHEIFRHCQTWNFRQKNVILPFLHIFSDKTIFLNYCRDAHDLFGTVRPFFSTEKCHATPPPPFIRKNFSKREFFSKIGGFLHKNFRHCEMNNFRREIVTPFLCIKFFDYPKFLKNWRDAYAFFGTVRHEIFDRKTWFTSYA